MSEVVLADGTGDPSTIPTDAMPVISWKKKNNALSIKTKGGWLKLQPVLRKALRVQFAEEHKLDSAKNYGVLKEPDAVEWTLEVDANTLSMITPDFIVKISRSTSRIQLFSADGSLLLQEPAQGGRVNIGEHVRISNVFELTPDEALYGLGQYRDNVLNLRGHKRELVQFNTQAAVPVLLSTKGWGMFWDNPGRTLFSDGAGGMSFASDEGSELSYYLFVGDHLDDIVAAYRELTGPAPLPPKWALGYHQSRNKYRTQDEVLSIAKRMREEHIPMDSIFIDYFYWEKHKTGSHKFDEDLFPDVPGMLKTLHDELNTKVVITVWPTFAKGTKHYEELHANGFLLEGVKALDGTVYDAFNPSAAAMYWNQLMETLIPTGIDGFFLDGPEPDHVNSFLKSTTYDGPATHVRNLYPLVHATTFANGLLEAYPNKRPYILTRCAWAGQQRTGTAVWSGDIKSDFDELRKQVTAGLNFVASGIPYWTTDIGGYSGGDAADESYREVFTRWWQYGTFCPVFRAHGRRFPGDRTGPNELWAFGPKVQSICSNFGNLRYRLMPYIYSLSDRVWSEDYTPMRLMAFDFPQDKKVRDIKDQFMYGPAFMVNPVLAAGVNQRDVYLPAGSSWFDFWSGQVLTGGQTLSAPAPIERIPLFVRAGSIVPMGAKDQYVGEASGSPIEIRVYRGADGMFTLYEDDGESHSYQKGVHVRIPFHWSERLQTLTIGQREGDFSGMQKAKTFHIVWVAQKHGVGVDSTKADHVVEYTGRPVKIRPSSVVEQK